LSFTQNFKIFDKAADVTLDFYRTDFQNQAIVDVMQSPQQVLFYNLKGESYANSLQLDFNLEIVKHLNLRTAYKYYDISTDYISGTLQRPLQAKHRLFGNVEYETHISDEGQQWRFDATVNWLGKQLLPTTATNPIEDRLPEFSPSFTTLNMQITLQQSSTLEFYFGGENIGNYRQTNAIVGEHNPFGVTFDTSIVYGPVFGQMFYAGLRFKIK